MSKLKFVWKRLPLTVKMQAIGWLLVLFVALLILLSMCGGVSNYGEQFDNNSALSSQAFSVEWQDGSKQEIKDFNADGTSKNLRSFTLIAKKPVTLDGFVLGTSEIANNVTFFVVAIGLPQAGPSGNADEQSALGTYTLTGKETEHHVALNNSVALLENARVTLTFDANVALEYLAVSFTEGNNL